MTDEEFLEDYLLRVEERHDVSRFASFDELLQADSSLRRLAESHRELRDELEDRFSALRRFNRLLSREKAGSNTWPEIPGYSIQAELGCGGMAVVYKAMQLGLKRVVALKVMTAYRPAGQRTAVRFQAEAEAVAKLEHPNIVRVFETGRTNQAVYLAMELVGDSLAKRLAGTPQPERWCAEVARAIALAVDFAHQRGIIHRDLKPSNILLAEDETPKVADFGLAKSLGDNSALTRTGEIPGTPSYMAPEQARGDATPAVDQYALGVTLYEMLTGRTPFLAETSAETLLRVQQDDPPPVRSLRPNVSGDLEAICLKCLEKNPGERYATVGALAADLERFLNGEPTAARPLGALGRAVRWIRRKPLPAALAATTVLLITSLVAGAGLYGRAAARHEGQLRRTNYPRALAQVQKVLQQGRLNEAKRLLDDVKDDHGGAAPGFAWRHLAALAARRPVELVGHVGEVYGVAFSPDGKTLASAGQDDVIRLWNLQDGSPTKTLVGHSADVNGVVFSPDGRFLYSASDDTTLRRWDLKGEGASIVLAQHPLHVRGLALSPDGAQVYTVLGGDRHLRAWSATNPGKPLAVWKEDAIVDSVAVARDGTVAAGSSHGCRVARLSESMGLIARIHHGEWDVQPVSVCFAGAEAAVGGKKGEIAILDPKTFQVRRRWKAHFDEVSVVCRSPDDAFLVSSSPDGMIHFWDHHAGACIDSLPAESPRVWTLEISPGKERLAAACGDGRVRIWTLGSTVGGPHCRLISRAEFDQDSFKFLNRDGATLTYFDAQGRLVEWDIDVDKERRKLTLAAKPDRSRWTVSDDGRFLGVCVKNADGERIGQVWHLAAEKPELLFEQQVDPVGDHRHSNFAFPANTDLAAVFPVDGKVKLFDCVERKITREFSAPTNPLGLEWFDRQQRLLTFSFYAEYRIREYDWDSMRLRTELSFPNGLDAYACDPRGRFFVVGHGRKASLCPTSGDSEPRSIELWGEVLSLAVSPSEPVIAAGLDDSSIRLLDAADGRELLALPGRADLLAFSADGNVLTAVSVSSDRFEIMRWFAPTLRSMPPNSLH